MREPLDDDDCQPLWSDRVEDEIKQLKSDNAALRMLLRDCKQELDAYQHAIARWHGRSVLERRFMLIKQIDDELKSE